MNKKKISIITGLIVVFILAIGAGLWSRGSADRAQEKLDLGVKYISENDFDKAILAYNDAIKIDPKQVKAYQGLARVYTLQSKYDEAKAAYDKGVAAVAMNDQNTLRLGLAGMYIDKGQLPDAEKAFQEIINGSQNCLEAYWGLAMVYQKQSDNSKAEATLRQAVAKYPDDYRCYNTLALFLKQNNKADDAFNNIVKSLSIELNQQEAYLILTDLYKGRWTELQTKLSTVSNQQISGMLEFYMYYASADYPKVVNAYKTKLSGQSGNYKARILSAIAMFKSGDKSGSETLIKQVLNEKFNDWLLSDVASYYQVAGDNEKARLSAIKAIQANGTNLEAVALLHKMNTGDEKKYATEYLLYNWKPVAKAKEDLQVLGSTNLNSKDELKLTPEYFIPDVNKTYTYRYSSSNSQQPKPSDTSATIKWNKSNAQEYIQVHTILLPYNNYKQVETFKYKVQDGSVLLTSSDWVADQAGGFTEVVNGGKCTRLKAAGAGESWDNYYQNLNLDSQQTESIKETTTFIGVESITVMGTSKQAAHLHVKGEKLNGNADSGGRTTYEDDYWLVPGLGIVRQTSKQEYSWWTSAAVRGTNIRNTREELTAVN
ncbi:MAG: tetratricopeptide repeat protein [Syntrophomonadaceae bacterium]